jgi:signal transduction histidine kinase
MRSALAAAFVVAVVSILAGGVLLVTARQILVSNVDNAADDRAAQVEAALGGGGASLGSLLRPSARWRSVVQVVDANGTVVAASDAVLGQQPLSGLRPVAGQRLHERRRLPFAHDETFRVVAAGVRTPQGERTVLVAESLDVVEDGTEAVVAALVLGLPALTVVVGGATFLFVGRTLRPVEAMRRQAASITSRNLGARLPVPRTDDEVAALAATMNTMLDRIESASAAQRRFVADASHELRSPLATIGANADLLEDAGLAEGPARSVGRIRAESARMARLVEDLLLLARYDDRGVVRRRAEVDLDDLAYAEHERLALEHPGLVVDGSIAPVRVEGDPDALQRALRNLVDNAARYASSTVTVTVSEDGGTGEILVANDGPAIAAADRVRIFDRFVRLDDSRSRTVGGTGLGLAIARDIVVAHRGEIIVDELDKGATMRIRIPTQA